MVAEGGDGPHGIAGVDGAEKRLTTAGRGDGDMGALGVADFTDEEEVGIEAEHGTDGFGEMQAAFGIHFDLSDAVQAALHGVFDGDDAAREPLQLVQQSIQRGGLPGTDGTADEKHALHATEPVPKTGLILIGHAKIVQAEQRAAGVEQTDAGHFAGWRGGDGGAQFHQRAARLHAAMTVLRPREHRGVDASERLEVGDQTMAGKVRHLGHVMQDAVHTQAKAGLSRSWLDVDIRGFPLYRVGHHCLSALPGARLISGRWIGEKQLLKARGETRLHRSGIGRKAGNHGGRLAEIWGEDKAYEFMPEDFDVVWNAARVEQDHVALPDELYHEVTTFLTGLPHDLDDSAFPDPEVLALNCLRGFEAEGDRYSRGLLAAGGWEG
jgi:hypothetical protein